jgi:phosphoenolpyruvate carboxylase
MCSSTKSTLIYKTPFHHLQLRLLRRHRSAHHISNITRRLVKEERHAFAAKVLADDVELHTVLVDHVGDSV